MCDYIQITLYLYSICISLLYYFIYILSIFNYKLFPVPPLYRGGKHERGCVFLRVCARNIHIFFICARKIVKKCKNAYICVFFILPIRFILNKCFIFASFLNLLCFSSRVRLVKVERQFAFVFVTVFGFSGLRVVKLVATYF